MKWGAVFGITLIVMLIIFYEWPRIDQRRAKAAFLGLTAVGWCLGIFLVFFPEAPTPVNMLNQLLEPLGRLLEK